jgi:diadenosine tetraphosphate (Ap4A) HIT family hydrolase
MIETPRTAQEHCPFCNALTGTNSLVKTSSDSAVGVLLDGFPVTPGHALVVPYEHQADLLSLTQETTAALWRTALEHAITLQAEDTTIEGFNFGVNVGLVAGQTVGHVHLHVIPRRSGDTTDPRGGVRWVVPETAKYWAG